MKFLIALFLFVGLFNTMTGTIDNYSTVGTLTYINENCDFSFDEVIKSYNELIEMYKKIEEAGDFKDAADLQMEYKSIIAGDGNIFQKLWNVIKWFFENAFNSIIALLVQFYGAISLICYVLLGVSTAFLVDLLELALSIIGVLLYILGVPVTL